MVVVAVAAEAAAATRVVPITDKSQYLLSPLTKTVQLCLLENIFPMERNTWIFKGCGTHLKLKGR